MTNPETTKIRPHILRGSAAPHFEGQLGKYGPSFWGAVPAPHFEGHKIELPIRGSTLVKGENLTENSSPHSRCPGSSSDFADEAAHV